MNAALPAITAFTGLLANAGTPLILSGAFHLFIGNTIIGVIEGWMLTRWFRFSRKSAVVMIAANYASAWAAFNIVTRIPPDQANINNVVFHLLSAVLVSWLLTIVIEWPFVAFSLRPGNALFRRGFIPNLVVQTVSYIAMIAWYAWLGEISLITSTKPANARELPLPASVIIYFIGGDGAIHSLDGTSTVPTRITGPLERKPDRLLAMPIDGARNEANLCALMDDQKTELVLRVPAHSIISENEGGEPQKSWFNFGNAPLLGDPAFNPWKVRSGFWALEGLRAENVSTGESYHLALESPFLMWHVRSTILLPDGKLLFQLGRNQICLLDLPTRRIRLLANGRGPAAVITRHATP